MGVSHAKYICERSNNVENTCSADCTCYYHYNLPIIMIRKHVHPYNLINDEFTEDKINKYGGESTMYSINCKNCELHIMDYQKDGNGPLLRIYYDRINNICRTPVNSQTVKSTDKIICKHCNSEIANVMKYAKHGRNRLCYTLISTFY
jgi:hypothetical protein